jgi:hypothetical protein
VLAIRVDGRRILPRILQRRVMRGDTFGAGGEVCVGERAGRLPRTMKPAGLAAGGQGGKPFGSCCRTADSKMLSIG